MKGTDGYSDSDEDTHDAYLERMKQEGKIREEADGSDESEGDSGTWCTETKRVMLLTTKMACLSVVQWPKQSPNVSFILSLDESFNPGEEEDEVAEE